MVKLGKLLKPSPKKAAGELEAPILSITMHDGLVEQGTRFKKRIASLDTSIYRIVFKGQLVVGFPIDEGVLDFQDKYRQVLVSPAYGVWDLVSDEVTPEFLGLFLKSPRAISIYKSRLRGTTARRRSLPTKVFQEIEFPLPPLGEQKRIAEILGGAVEAEQHVQDTLELLNEVAKSSFYTFCGIPDHFERRKKLGEIAIVATGNTPPRKDPSNYGSYIEWIKSDNLGSIFPTPASEFLSEEGVKRGRVAAPGSLLMTCIAGSIKSIGKCSVVNREVAFNQQINSIKPVNNEDLYYLYLLFYVAPYLVQRRSTGGLKGIVKKSSLEMCEIPWPERKVRQMIGTFCQEWINCRLLVMRKLSLLQELQKSLATRVFAGLL